VGTLGAQVEGERVDPRVPHDGPQVARPFPGRHRSGAVDPRAVLPPPGQDLLGIVGGISADQRHHRHRPRHVRVVVHRCTHVDDGDQATRHPHRGPQIQRLALNRRDRLLGVHQADLSLGAVPHVQKRPARSRDPASLRRHPQQMDARRRPGLGDPREPTQVDERVVDDHHDRGERHRLVPALGRAPR